MSARDKKEKRDLKGLLIAILIDNYVNQKYKKNSPWIFFGHIHDPLIDVMKEIDTESCYHPPNRRITKVRHSHFCS